MKAIENLKSYFKSVSDRNLLKKFEDDQYFFRCGDEKRVRWFELVGQEERIWALQGGYISGDETLSLLFPKYANIVAPYMNKLSRTQFSLILQEGYFDALKGYVENHTLSYSYLCAFINVTVNRAGEKAQKPMSDQSKRLPDLLCEYIIREGLYPSLYSFIEDYPDELIGSLKQRIRESRAIHYACCAVKSVLKKEEVPSFGTYLKWLQETGSQMPIQAIMMMNCDQIKAFHDAGFHLPQKAIVAFLAADKEGTITTSILDHEVLSPTWPELQHVLETRPDTYRLYQIYCLDGRIKRADS